MTQKMKNFRAEDMPGAKLVSYTKSSAPDGGKGPEEPKQSNPEPTGAANEGTAEEVKTNVGDDLDKIQAAIEAEYAEEDPRTSLIEDLESRQRRLQAEQEAAQGDGDGDGEDEPQA